ncbi:hypothetical protein EMGBS15_09660 [Filimonas sp.]|nr:hypothetical protein EMGBS15_09660 [Filimonas sp.]
MTFNTSGSYAVSLTVSDGSTNSTKSVPNYITTTGSALPLSEGFEGADNPPIGWKNIDNGTPGITWAKVNSAGGFGLSTYSMMFDNYSWNYPGEKDELYVKRVNFSSFSTIKLKFDVAYQVFSGYSDSLAVLVSTDCGATFTKVYQKGGTVLSSAGSGGNNFVPTAAQWRTDSVLLNSFTGQQNVLIAFQNINGYGNKLYLDNINITGICTAPALPAISATSTNLCIGQSTTITVASGSLNSALNWNWYSGSCGGPLVGAANSITVSPAASTTYFVRGEGGCVTPGSCTSIPIIVNSLPVVNASNVSGCSGTPISLSGLPAGEPLVCPIPITALQQAIPIVTPIITVAAPHHPRQS